MRQFVRGACMRVVLLEKKSADAARACYEQYSKALGLKKCSTIMTLTIIQEWASQGGDWRNIME
jgi:hypothetical protein